jgi:hypothetical protein
MSGALLGLECFLNDLEDRRILPEKLLTAFMVGAGPALTALALRDLILFHGPAFS